MTTHVVTQHFNVCMIHMVVFGVICNRQCILFSKGYQHVKIYAKEKETTSQCMHKIERERGNHLHQAKEKWINHMKSAKGLLLDDGAVNVMEGCWSMFDQFHEAGCAQQSIADGLPSATTAAVSKLLVVSA